MTDKRCRHPTKKGAVCKNRVKGDWPCHLHGGPSKALADEYYAIQERLLLAVKEADEDFINIITFAANVHERSKHDVYTHYNTYIYQQNSNKVQENNNICHQALPRVLLKEKAKQSQDDTFASRKRGLDNKLFSGSEENKSIAISGERGVRSWKQRASGALASRFKPEYVDLARSVMEFTDSSMKIFGG